SREFVGGRALVDPTQRARLVALERLELLASEAVLGGPRPCRLAPRRGLDPRLFGTARVQGGALGGLRGARVRAVLREPGVDLPPALAELAQDLGRHALDLGDAIVRLGPADPRQALADRVAEVGLVEVAGGLGVDVEGAAVEARVAPVGPLGEVGGDDVGVELWVLGAAHPVAVGRGDEALASEAHTTTPAAPNAARLALQVGQRLSDRLVVGL